MATGRGKNSSDAELRQAVIAGWHRLETKVRSTPDRLASLAKLTGLPFRQLDMARRVRNKVAHPDDPVPRDRLLAALRIIEAAEQQLKSRKRPPNRRAKSARSQTNQVARTRRPSPSRAQPATPINWRNIVLAVVVFGVSAAIFAAVLLLLD